MMPKLLQQPTVQAIPPLRFGVLGAGEMGKTHAAVLSQLDGAQLVAVGGGSVQSAGKLADAYQVRFYEEVADLIDDPTIDVVDVCLPTFLHERCVTMAANAGKHIICEKPLALSRKEAMRMASAVEAAGVYFMVAQVVRFWPEYIVIKQLLDDRTLGQPLAAYAARLHEPRPVQWLKNPDQGGGALFDLHIHDLDYLYCLFGMPESTYAVGQKSKSGTWDCLYTTLDFGQVKAVAEASYLLPSGYPFSTEFRLVCTEGAVTYRSGFAGGAEHSELVLYRPGQPPASLDKPMIDGYRAQLQYFAGMVTQGKAPAIATMAEACEVLEIAIAIQQSLVSGRIVSLSGSDI